MDAFDTFKCDMRSTVKSANKPLKVNQSTTLKCVPVILLESMEEF